MTLPVTWYNVAALIGEATMPSTAKRQQEFRKRMRAAGYTQTTTWVPGIYAAEHAALVEKLKRRFERERDVK
jgi:hypothetical protein